MQTQRKYGPQSIVYLASVALTLLGGLIAYKGPFCAKSALRAQGSHTPENTIIAFDFHGVLVKRSSFLVAQDMASIFWNTNQKGRMIWYAPFIAKELVFNGKTKLLDDILDCVSGTCSPFVPVAEQIHAALNKQDLIPGSVALIHALKKAGYHVYIASNISPKSFKTMEKRPEFTEFFKLFDGIYTAHKEKKDGTLYANQVKPAVEYFYGLREFITDEHPEDAKKQIIFIDDKWSYLNGSVQSKTGIIPILFTNEPNLQNQLQSKGMVF